MINLRLISYELKGIIFTKKYFYINLILILLSISTLNASLSPYSINAAVSKWTYADFIAQINSFIITFIVILVAKLFSNNEKKAKNIIFSTILSEKGYYAIKQSGIFISMITSLAIVIITSFIWYGYYLRFYNFYEYLYPITILAIPPIIFILGFSINIGRWSERAIYILIPIIFIFTSLNLNLPPWIDIAGNNSLMILSILNGRNAQFILPEDFIWSRILMLVVGILLIICGCRKSKA